MTRSSKIYTLFCEILADFYLPDYSRRKTIVLSNVIQSKIKIVSDGFKVDEKPNVHYHETSYHQARKTHPS